MEGASGVRAAREVATEVGGVAGYLGKYSSRVSSGGSVVLGKDVGDISSNGTYVRVIAYGFPAIVNKVKGKADEGQVVAEGSRKIFLQGVGGPTNYS